MSGFSTSEVALSLGTLDSWNAPGNLAHAYLNTIKLSLAFSVCLLEKKLTESWLVLLDFWVFHAQQHSGLSCKSSIFFTHNRKTQKECSIERGSFGSETTQNMLPTAKQNGGVSVGILQACFHAINTVVEYLKSNIFIRLSILGFIKWFIATNLCFDQSCNFFTPIALE